GELIAARDGASEPGTAFRLAQRVIDALMIEVVAVLRAAFASEKAVLLRLSARVTHRRKQQAVHTPAASTTTEPAATPVSAARPVPPAHAEAPVVSLVHSAA